MLIVLLILNLKLMIIYYIIKKLICLFAIISICIIKKENIHYPIFKLQKCFNENENF